MISNAVIPADKLITASTMFVPLLACAPSFEASWDAFMRDWSDTPEPPMYIALCDLARHLIDRLAAGRTDGFDDIFDVVERWHVEGDSYVREAASIGLLEDLQNEHLHRTTRPSDFVAWLRPQSQIGWDKIDGFWAGEESPGNQAPSAMSAAAAPPKT